MSDFHDRAMPNFDTYGFSWPGGPDYEPPPAPRCTSCGGFLPWNPDSQETTEETVECDGSATESREERTGALLDILGPGSDTHFMSACGSDGGKHQPHTEVVSVWVTLKTACHKCGTLNVEVG